MKLDASLIISVYNKILELELVLAGISRQTYKRFEIIIADDGSEIDMKQFIENYKNNFQNELKYIWHEDKGFRKNRILNEAIKASSSDYLIFIDGDCIPHNSFIQAHIEESEKNCVLCGSRVMLSESYSTALSTKFIQMGKLERLNFRLLADAIRGKASRLEESIKSGFLKNINQRKISRILGSNYSVEKSLLEEINGFDERYEGPGLGEDSDIEFRLGLLGVKFKSVRNYAILYHLYHQKTIELTENWRIFKETKQSNSPICTNGLEKLRD